MRAGAEPEHPHGFSSDRNLYLYFEVYDPARFQLQVPLSRLKPGTYTAQLNVIDDAGGDFTFPRMALMVRERY